MAATAYKSRMIMTRPSYFGPSSRQLYGVYDTPERSAATGPGVVLCYPHGRDYVAAFRAFRVLATRLADAGLPVLRFDYSGTGDSWGDPEHASVAQWTDDTVRAIQHLRSIHAGREIVLVGLRLGATLATLAALAVESVERLVLWEPVTEGRPYVAELRARHRAWLDAEVRERRRARMLARGDELLGDAFTDGMARDIERVSLASLPAAPARNVLVVSQETNGAYAEIARQLQALGSRVDMRHVAGPRVWGTSPGTEQALVPHEVLRTIVDWLGAARS